MAIEATIELDIARTPEAVWQELTAVERFPEWLVASGVTRVEREGGPAAPLTGGTRLRIEQAIAGRPAILEGAITALEPTRRFAFHARHPDGITVDADAVLVPQGPGTRLRWAMRVGLPLRLRLFEGMAAPEVRRAAATDLMGLKRRLEAVAG